MKTSKTLFTSAQGRTFEVFGQKVKKRKGGKRKPTKKQTIKKERTTPTRPSEVPIRPPGSSARPSGASARPSGASARAPGASARPPGGLSLASATTHFAWLCITGLIGTENHRIIKDKVRFRICSERSFEWFQSRYSSFIRLEIISRRSELPIPKKLHHCSFFIVT